MNILILHPSYYYCIGLSRSLEEKDETVSAYYDTDIKTFDMKGFDVILTSPKMSLVFRRNMNDILLDKTKIIVLEPKILEQHDDEPDNDYYCDGRICENEMPETFLEKIDYIIKNAKEKFLRFRTKRDRLSSREYQVAMAILSYHKNKNIAYLLGINEKTVSTYKARIFKKLEINSVLELEEALKIREII